MQLCEWLRARLKSLNGKILEGEEKIRNEAQIQLIKEMINEFCDKPAIKPPVR